MKNPVDAHIGQRLRHRRWLKGMTQLQLAQAIGLRFQQIQKYETGANRISASTLWVLAQSLDVSVSFFFVGLDNQNHSSQIPERSDPTLHQKETADLVRAYYAMDEGPRLRLLELAKAASKSELRSNQDSQNAA